MQNFADYLAFPYACLSALMPVLQGEAAAYEALQILCYRNAVVCEQMVAEGIREFNPWGYIWIRGRSCANATQSCASRWWQRAYVSAIHGCRFRSGADSWV